jgi:hypothetical protein
MFSEVRPIEGVEAHPSFGPSLWAVVPLGRLGYAPSRLLGSSH